MLRGGAGSWHPAGKHSAVKDAELTGGEGLGRGVGGGPSVLEELAGGLCRGGRTDF